MSLNRRLFTINRLRNHLSSKSITKMIDGIFMSKIRYGIHLMGKVRTSEVDPSCTDMDNIQKVQNKLARMITRTKLEDKVSTKSLLAQLNLMSVNQINAQIKIQEIWKAMHIEDYPLKLERQTVNELGATTRAGSSGKLIEFGRSVIAQKTCINDAIKLWNQAPKEVTQCNSLYQIKIHYYLQII